MHEKTFTINTTADAMDNTPKMNKSFIPSNANKLSNKNLQSAASIKPFCLYFLILFYVEFMQSFKVQSLHIVFRIFQTSDQLKKM